MISSPGWLSPTRIVGLVSYSFAFASCAIARVRSGAASRVRPLATILALLDAALFLDMTFNGRWLLHDLLANQAAEESLYAQRRGPQAVALILVGCSVVAAITLILRHFRARPGAALAASGGMLSLCFWLIDVISLHAVDAVMYHQIVGVMRVSLGWVACALMTGLGIFWDTQAARSGAR